ncbi:MAG TPA: dienelactone hydrolase family protein [Acidimicrobiia bacterium]|jgi:carboxymethylenebutenolidase
MTTEIATPMFTARPTSDPPWPGVIVIHEGNGMSPQLLRFCERLAREGYATAAPDLFFRSGGSEAADFATLIGALRPEEVRADLDGAVAALRAEGASAVGITGFCMGGSIAYRAALVDVDVACAAPFYGATIGQELGAPHCPVLCFFGGTDEYIPPEAINAVRAHHGDDVIVYPDAGHGFMRDGSPNFDEQAAADAWTRLLAFFAQHLR